MNPQGVQELRSLFELTPDEKQRLQPKQIVPIQSGNNARKFFILALALILIVVALSSMSGASWIKGPQLGSVFKKKRK